MKKAFSIFMIAVSAVLMFSCKGDPFGYLPPDSSPSLVYRGDVSYSEGDNTYITTNNLIEVSLQKDTLYIFKLYGAAFNEQMKPVDLKITGVSYWQEGPNSFFKADGIVPTVGSSKRPDLTVRNLDANIYKGILILSMKCGEYDVTFSGVQVLE